MQKYMRSNHNLINNQFDLLLSNIVKLNTCTKINTVKICKLIFFW